MTFDEFERQEALKLENSIKLENHKNVLAEQSDDRKRKIESLRQAERTASEYSRGFARAMLIANGGGLVMMQSYIVANHIRGAAQHLSAVGIERAATGFIYGFLAIIVFILISGMFQIFASGRTMVRVQEAEYKNLEWLGEAMNNIAIGLVTLSIVSAAASISCFTYAALGLLKVVKALPG